MTKQQTSSGTQITKSHWHSQQVAHLRLRRWVGGVSIAVIIMLVAGFCYMVPVCPWWLLWATAGGVAVIAPLGFWYAGAAFRRYAFCLDDMALHIRKGVFWHTQTTVPLNRVQHTDIIQGPLQRRYGLAKLVIHTAGTRHALVILEGITQLQATTLRQALSFNTGEGAV